MANTNDLPAGTAFHSLALAGGGYTIGGAQIGLSAGIVNKATAAAENVLGFGIRLDAPQTFQNLSRSALTINGPIVSQGNALTIDGPGPIVVAGAISGLVPLQKAGPGTTVLTGRNTYSGGTTVTAGTLVAAHADALPAGGSLTIGPGGTVVLAAGISAASAGEAPAKVLASPVSAATGFVTVPMSIGQITDTAASATNTAPPTSQGMGVQRQTPITMAVQVQPAADPTPVGSMQVSTEGGDAAVFPPPSTSNSAAVTKPVVKLGPAFSAQLKAHDAALQAAVSRSRTDLSWLWALEETWSRRPWPKKNADAVAAVDQGLAGLPG
jgi:autotransporter-associated beta strand protein